MKVNLELTEEQYEKLLRHVGCDREITDVLKPAYAKVDAHPGRTNDPHSVTKTQVNMSENLLIA